VPRRLTESLKTPLLLLVLILLSGGTVFQAEASLDSRLFDAAEAGADPEEADKDGNTPLILAAGNGTIAFGIA
jgi:ankyrin repeat protein